MASFILRLIAASITSLSLTAIAAPVLQQAPKMVELKGDAGGRLDGTAWSSAMIKDKVWCLFYVDPDHRDENEALKDALKAENFPTDKYGTIAVINMDATWLPNGIVSSSLKSNQEKFPDVTYVKDMKKLLVKEWQLADDAYVVVLFDKQGKIIFNREGDFNKADTATIIKLIREHLND